jgi:hypothetical protein
MADKTLIFDFFNLSGKDRAIAAAKRYFARAGATVVSVDVDKTVSKTMGVAFREVQFSFSDSQVVAFGIKESGDVFAVKVNGKQVPLHAQDDHIKAVAEIVSYMDRGRAKFQAAMARARVALPPTVRTAAPRLEQVWRDKVAGLNEAIGIARATLGELRGNAS